MLRKSILMLTAVPLAACQSFSFAPPSVRTDIQVARYDDKLDCKAVPKPGNGTTIEIQPTVLGAIDLINNFTLAYRCAEQDLANGRQYFEVPAFLAAAAGLIGPSAFAFSSQDVLKLGAAGAVLGAGNSYYAPKAKAGFVTSALRAVLCVKTAAVGISYFNFTPPKTEPPKPFQALFDQYDRDEAAFARLLSIPAEKERATSLLAQNAEDRRAVTSLLTQQALAEGGGEVSIDSQRQYFEMVGAALYSIESILAKRLSDAGTVDTTDVFKRLQQLAKEHDEAQKKLGAARAATNLSTMADQLRALPKDIVTLENEALQPQLQVCVQQAYF